MSSPQSADVQWMYKNSSDLINREDYLLGRKIDKGLEQIESEKNTDGKQIYETKLPKNHVEHECIPFSIRAYRGIVSTEQVDIQRKVMEDPLTVIKQKEIETRRKILENPVKLKELRGLLRSESEITKDEESRTKNRSTSNTNRKRKNSSHEQNNDKLDKLVLKKYGKIKKILNNYGAKKTMSVRKLVKTSKKKISKEFRKIVKQSKKRKRSPSNSSNEHHSRKTKEASPKKQYKRQEERKPKSREMVNTSINRKEKYLENTRKGHTQDIRRNERRISTEKDNISYRKDRLPERVSSNSTRNKEITETRKHRSSEEKEAYRKMMMENAVWNDEKCAQNAERYRNERRKEEESQYNSEFNKDFISRELLSSLSSKGSVESRIKSNLNNIQRCPGSMESKFL